MGVSVYPTMFVYKVQPRWQMVGQKADNASMPLQHATDLREKISRQ